MSQNEYFNVIALSRKLGTAGLSNFGTSGMNSLQHYTSPLLVHIVTLQSDEGSDKQQPKLRVVDNAAYAVHEDKASKPYLLVDGENNMRLVFAITSSKPAGDEGYSDEQVLIAAKFLTATIDPKTRLAAQLKASQNQVGFTTKYEELSVGSPLKQISGNSIGFSSLENV